MIPLEKLLAPISAESECGEDLSYDPAFQELETLILGKPETQFSAAEPPDWKEIRQRSLALLERSKHLRLVVTLTAALVRLEGLPGFRDGVKVLKSLIDQWWEKVYPRLDPEDDNDPTERVNIIAALAMPAGSFGDPLKFLETLRGAPLCDSVQMGRFSLTDLANSAAGVESTKEKPVPAKAQIEAAFRDTKPETLTATHECVAEALTLVSGLQEGLGTLVGAHRAPEFDPLLATLREIQKTLSPYLPVSETVSADSSLDELLQGSTPPPLPVAAGQLRSAPGSVESRDDVMRALDAICTYYSRNEPSSPIPLLLQRAKRLVAMDFMAILEDMSPEAVTQINTIAGIK